MFTYALGTVFQIAFYHQTFYQALDIIVWVSAVYDILGDIPSGIVDIAAKNRMDMVITSFILKNQPPT